ncbi:MAG: transglycosylase SLT domain-containing protein [Bdellovibrionales bacterium]
MYSQGASKTSSIRARVLAIFLVGFAGANFVAMAASSHLEQARALVQAGQGEKALAALAPLLEITAPEDERVLALVLAGQIHLSLGQPEQARENLEKSLVLKSAVSAYAFTWLGESYYRLKRYKDARTALERVGYFKPPAELRNRVRLLLADIALGEKNYGEAERHLSYLERKWRGSLFYPHVLWRHLQAATVRRNRGTACRLARRLYAQYPTHPLIYDWSMDLQNVRVEGQRLGCVASSKDQSSRVRRLQLAGETDRARREMEQLRGSGRRADVERADMMLVQFLTSDGYPDEALKILVKYYDSHKNDVNFLLSLARAAARGGEFQTAVGLYQRVHVLVPRARVGREALFQAAFLSYQFQDYDGATRRFDRFIDLYAKSGLAKDARWNLAWLRYLRGDFEGAYDSLMALRAPPKGRRRRAPTRDDRAIYWSAMCLAKMGKSAEAKELFDSLEKPDPSSFYALAARARRESLPAPKLKDELPLRDLAATAPAENPTVVNPLEAADAPSENESEDNLTLNQEDSQIGEDGGENAALELGDEILDSDTDEKVEISDFRDPRLRRHFEVAQDLLLIGMPDWARHELFEVERRTRNPGYLKSLIKSYEAMGSYHRSVAISDTFFVGERLQGGYSGAKGLWETSYPRAFRNYVERFADQFSTPSELVWAIMRAESHFKPDVMSPVGAKGLLQLMPNTGLQVSRILDQEENFQVMSLLNPEVNVRLGTRYLLRLSTKFKNSWPLVAAAYNAGPHRVDNWLTNFGHLEMDEFIEHIPFLETRNYVKKVVRNYAAYRALYSNDQRILAWLADPVPVKGDGRPALREIWDTP